MSAELFGCEGFCFLFVNVIDGVVGEVFMLSIVATSSGVDVVCCGDAVGWVICLIYIFVVVRAWFVGRCLLNMMLVRALGFLFG
jgi:hypothetical protein